MKNTTKYYVYNVLINLMLIFSTGSIIQSFLGYKSISSADIGIFTSWISIIQVVMMFLSLFFADRIKNVKKSIAFMTFPRFIFFAAMMYLCKSGAVGKPVFYAAMAGSIINNIFLGSINVLIYKLPYEIIDMRDYPKVQSSVGVISNITAILFSLFFLRLASLFEYENMIFWCFGLCAVFSFAASRVCASMKRVEAEVPHSKCSKFSLAMFKMPSVYLLAVPNFIRGAAMGIIGMASVIMLSVLTDSTAVSSSLSILLSAATISACLVYKRLLEYVKPIWFTLAGGIIMCASMCLMLVGKSTAVFCVMYFTAYFGMTFVDNSIPIYVTKIVSYENIGEYTSLRMLLTVLGTAAGNYIAGIMADNYAGAVLAAGGIIELLAALGYYAASKKIKCVM